MDMVIKNVKHVELNANIASADLNTQTLNMIQQYTNSYVVTGIAKIKFDDDLRQGVFNTNKFCQRDIKKIYFDVVKMCLPI